MTAQRLQSGSILKLHSLLKISKLSRADKLIKLASVSPVSQTLHCMAVKSSKIDLARLQNLYHPPQLLSLACLISAHALSIASALCIAGAVA